MPYGTKIGIFDGNPSLSTSFTNSESILVDGKISEIQIRLTGNTGDSDNAEIYQFSSKSTIFDTDGIFLGRMALNGTTEVIKSFYSKKSKYIKVGVKMESGSIETPSMFGSYSIIS